MAKKDFSGALSGERKSRLSGIVSPQQQTPEETKEIAVADVVEAAETTIEPKDEVVVKGNNFQGIETLPLIPDEAIEELRNRVASHQNEGIEEAGSVEVKADVPVVSNPVAEAAPKEKTRSSTRKAAEPKESKEKMNLFIETNYDFGVRIRAAAASEMMDLREFVETALTHYMNEVIGTTAVNRAVVKYKERNNLK
jgi:hypothetical protein